MDSDQDEGFNEFDNQSNRISQQSNINNHFDDNGPKPSHEFFSRYSIYFCTECKNMLTPSRPNSTILQFRCLVCKIKQVDFNDRKDNACIIYSKRTVTGSKRAVTDPNIVIDPTMPRIRWPCPQCDYPYSVYILTPADGQRKISAQLICGSFTSKNVAKCGKMFELTDTDYLRRYDVEKAINVYER